MLLIGEIARERTVTIREQLTQGSGFEWLAEAGDWLSWSIHSFQRER